MKPGDIISSWGDSGGGYAIVTSTSRHKHTIDQAEARETLLAEAVNGVIGRVDALDPWRPALAHIGGMRWHSVTKAEIDYGGHWCAGGGVCEPGGWCTEGGGAAWVDVLDLPNSVLYAIDAEMADA